MSSPPFSLSVIVFPVYASVFVLGGLFWLLLASAGLSGWLSVALAAFLTVPLGGFISGIIASLGAKQSGADGPPPKAFSFALRLTIGAIVAVGIAYAVVVLAALTPGFLVAGLTALVTAMILSLLFTFVLSTRSAS